MIQVGHLSTVPGPIRAEQNYSVTVVQMTVNTISQNIRRVM